MNISIFRKLNKQFLFVKILFLMCLFFGFNAYANNVSDITYAVKIHNDGSATVLERWVGTFNEGTENYIPISDKTVKINDFQVTMNGKPFEYVNYWNVDASFSSKKYKCGINKTYDGVELCFGISEYGTNTYTFSYKINPLVKSFDDYDGFNFMFLNPDMNIYPSNVNMMIALENGTILDQNNARIWGFGYDGDINFQDGKVVSYGRMYRNSNMTIMLRLDKNIINPSTYIGGSFDDIKNKAFQGSTYEETLNNSRNEDTFFKFAIFLAFSIFILTPLITIISAVARKMTLKKFYKECNYFRDTPNNSKMDVSYILYKTFDIWNNNESNVIGAIIMKMINDKNLEVLEEKQVGFFGKEKVKIDLRLVSEPADDLGAELYTIIKGAAGADGILQENELKAYAKQHYELLYNFLKDIENKGRNNLNKMNGYNKLYGTKLKDLSEIGKKELAEVYGLRKYLDEFTLISEREVQEVTIWENLLVYATLFGLAKKVLEQLKKVYPQKIVEIENYSKTIYVTDMYYRALYFNSLNASQMANAATLAKAAASGFGGHVSFGGGGGFSGGGMGGGSR